MKSKIPVVVILGHIDHGKTTLLEKIKNISLTEKETGGITQHIGAYEVEYQGKKITFIDTPGHEAFSEMRSQGAKVADIAILALAADEGVKPQTKEAIEVINKTNLPLIVALTKTDKENIDFSMAKAGLQKEGILIEEWGGKVPLIEVSGKTGKGLEELLSMINLLAELQELKTNSEKPAQGVIIESSLDPLRGPTGTLILENGVFKVGDIIVSQSTFGKIKTLEDFHLKPKAEIFPGEPAVITGFEKTPKIGESFRVVNSIEEAKREIEKEKIREKKEEEEEKKKETEKFIKIILRADVSGTLKAIRRILEDLVEEGIGIKILKAEIGEISDSDVRLAIEEEAEIIGFRTKPNFPALSLSRQKEKNIFIFEVIYDLIDNLRKIIREKKEKKMEKVDVGKMKVSVIFKTQKRGEKNYRQIIGGKITEGEVKKADVEIKRNEKICGRGKFIEIQEQKKKIEKAKAGQEIGALYEGNLKIKEGEELIIYEYREI